MRLFIGVPIPRDPRLNAVTNALRQAVPGAKPVPPGSWHVTLRFLGEIGDPRAIEDAMHTAVAGHKAMPVKLEGLGAFQGPRKARTVWAKVIAEGLRELAADVNAATADVGEPPHSDFVAHTTLARLPQPTNIEAFIDAHKTTFSEGVLDRVVLYRSQMTSKGPIYQRRLELPLGSL